MIETRQSALAVGGPLALGAFFGSPFGWQRVVEDGARLPLICLGTAALLAPTLYIGMARFRLLTSGLREIVAAHAQALARAGLVMLGLLPAAMFLGFSSWDVRVTLFVGVIVGAVAAGIGLSVVREIVGAMGGSVRVRTRPGAGSVFTIVLPVQTRAVAV